VCVWGVCVTSERASLTRKEDFLGAVREVLLRLFVAKVVHLARRGR
jgi:hypothetical protein